ncbi:MAG TPA: hypothetical protein ENL02_01910 [Epsilonproteobacteria bacterium]|nr:hypothetical protein [Campylobacterota bacterium]
MARKPRVDIPGFHHVFNRGTGRSKIYKSSEDKEMFLEILCKACKTYQVTLHDYCLIDNHYHLLIETSSENLSLFMRKINADYAIYFNKKYKRAGHLWQGRYSSWYIEDPDYLSATFRFIEHHPIKAKHGQTIGEYPYTLLAALFQKQGGLVPCTAGSKLNAEVNDKEALERLKTPLSRQEIKVLKTWQKNPVTADGKRPRQTKTISLHSLFKACTELPKRNEAILRALENGYTQGEVARYIGISSAMVSKIFRRSNSTVQSGIN